MGRKEGGQVAEIERRTVPDGESMFDAASHDDMLQQVARYLRIETEPSIPEDVIEEQYRERLNAALPLPVLSQEAVDLLNAHGDNINRLFALPERNDHDAEVRAEIHDYIRCSISRWWQLKVWAYRDHGYLFFSHRFFESRDGDPPSQAMLEYLGAVEMTRLTFPLSSHPTIHAYSPVLTGIEGISKWAEGTHVSRGKSRPPHVITSNGGMLSVGGDSTTVMDGAQEAAAFAAGLELSDDTTVAFVLSLARWCKQGNRRDHRSYAVVTVNEYCEARGWKKHPNGGYRPEHKEQARQEMRALNKAWVRHQVPDHLVTSDGTRYVEGPLMTVEPGSSDKAGRHLTSFRVAPGSWASDYLEDNPNCVALVLESVLRIDTRKTVGQLAQRIGLYMALQWRTKFLHNNGGQPHRISSLLAAAGIDPKDVGHHEERRRIRAYLTGEGGALDQLQGAGAIGTRDDAGALVDDWRYKNAEASDPAADASWGAWLDWTVLIPAPRDVIDFYKDLPLARQAAIKKEVASTGRMKRASNAARAAKAAGKE